MVIGAQSRVVLTVMTEGAVVNTVYFQAMH
jgi:hypothetical protein